MTRRLRALLAAVPGRRIGELVRDGIVLAGLGLAGYGISLYSQPAALIYAGAAIAALAFLSAPKPDEPGE